ncbi:MAG TPA: hypothetical protein VK603_13660, partial [Candidatus Saccharimonadales bacterium]|nr:hypothetical protein [Candidatus Saccharimonadales bacterium]
MATASDPVVIVSAARTPLGKFLGDLSPFSAHKLGSHVIGAAVERAKLSPERVDEVFMGCVLPAGQGQAPARQAARGAKLPDATGATTINKVCGSSMKATMLAHDIINAGSAEIVVSGGMESMSNAPYLLAKARGGYRAGHDRIIDHMMMDGLEDAYEVGRSMGDFGEQTAEAYQFSRKDQDTYAMETLTRARKAVEGGAFKAEIVSLTVTEKAGPRSIGNDEIPLKVDPAKIPRLKPAFRANGTITPAASSANADGAAALILARRSLAERDGPADTRRDQGSRHPQPGTAMVHDRADPRDPQATRQGRLERRRRRSVRDQRGLRGDTDGGGARSRHPARQTQHQWRRLCARPPHWR